MYEQNNTHRCEGLVRERLKGRGGCMESNGGERGEMDVAGACLCVRVCVSEWAGRWTNLSSIEPTKLWRANNLPNWIQSRLTTGGVEASGSIQSGAGWWRGGGQPWRRSMCVCLYVDRIRRGGGIHCHDKWARKWGEKDEEEKQRANTHQTDREEEEAGHVAWGRQEGGLAAGQWSREVEVS